MRIGMVCPYSFDEPGGVQAHILDLAEAFIAQGHEVSVLGPCSEDTDVPEYVVRGGSSIPIPYNGSVARLSFGPKMFSTVKAFIREGDFDVLHIHEPNSPSYSMAALRYAEGPIVATYHASSTGSKLLKAFLPVLSPMLEKVRAGIAVSEMARRWQVEQVGGDPVLIPNGVDTAKFAHARVPRAFDVDDPVEIVFLGRIDESRKGLDVLLRALTRLDRGVTCTVIGGGTPRTVSGVNFVGRVSDEEKAEILGRADIYVAPNTGGESFGIVLVEAMAAGCAVVASDLEAFSLVIDHESAHPAGLLFKTGSDADLAVKLQTLIDDPRQRTALISAGLKRAQTYDWTTVSARVMAVYETIAMEKVTLA
ncbi:GDP-mannose-dependent alpha-(1-2)-phosphatidylinositol mannosyltransferase [Corynebacterium deserti GIMN1.010]|uniref:GDP-mannose-dependent alpha-(1-2)-phosphatidylinositol mannosyltransferase n=1 Tax=Corynebacterium deserti GIMN1.010 TaxID=931089 RepID=A0A0M4CIR3_9CORY|nr:glycosyltransferase family 4 protein [Corynebacterium deserti]ALC06071.1 GDP-mannose-dependent alpha-(1-2)-phosphatidylinositol mannosyltransferase [Corynebacterium deserti GIMN1.010]